jgi:hypothetical protein
MPGVRMSLRLPVERPAAVNDRNAGEGERVGKSNGD